MKVAANKSESKKRKRENSQEIIPESPKKAKVHAQRKFAQGAAFNSPAITPIKDKVRLSAPTSSPGPMLTTKCPNTEDFLTFLCFRRTTILPPKLDFFKDAFTSEPEISSQGSSTTAKERVGISKSASQKLKNKKKEKRCENKKSQGSNSVQALKKKYQEQRLAKEKATNVTKLAKKVKGKNMVSTRSAGFVKESKNSNVKEAVVGSTRLRSGLMRTQTISHSKKKLKKEKLLRMGLRSGRSSLKSDLEKEGKLNKVNTSLKKADHENKTIKLDVIESPPKKLKSKKSEGLSDFSSDDNEPLAIKKPKSVSRTDVSLTSEKKAVTKSILKTRSKSTNKTELNNSTAVRPSRKTKEAAAIYMEMITKKLVSPEKSGDDDISSIESFPELPNAKRNEQRETEIKAKALASRKLELKEQLKDSPKEIKNMTSRKAVKSFERNEKSSRKVVKSNSKDKETKEKIKVLKEKINSSEDKKEGKRSIKEEPNKRKKEDKPLEQERVVLGHRPSTRSRQKEEPDGKVIKSHISNKPKSSFLKTPKVILKKTDEKLTSVVKKPGRKPKVVKTLLVTPKINNFTDNESIKKIQTESPVLERKESKKVNKKDEKKESSFSKRKNETETQISLKESKTKNEIITEKKQSDSVKKEKTTKNKEKEKQVDLKKDEKKLIKEENVSGKRPTRKCSAADKIWIDLDGFTSDEEDFLESRNDALKIDGVESKMKFEKDGCEKKLIKKDNKIKMEKAKEPESIKNTATEGKSEASEVKIKRKIKEENFTTPKSTFKKAANENTECKDIVNRNEKQIREKNIVKDLKTCENGSERIFLNEKKKTSPELTKESGRKKKFISNVKVPEKLESFFSDEKKESKKGSGVPKKIKPISKPIGNEILETKKTEGEEKKNPSTKRNFRGRKNKTEKKSDELQSSRRKRPIRQCSTGDKRWIETDSDSFTFYETSDDENRATELNSLTKTQNLVNDDSTKKVCPKVISETEEPVDNFSDSDEEPLRKKSLLIDDVVAKLSETKVDKFLEDANVVETKAKNTEKPIPALEPLNKNCVDTNTFYFSPSTNFQTDTLNNPSQINQVAGINIPTFPDVRQTILTRKTPSPTWKGFDQIPSTSLPSRIDMILHTLKRDQPCAEKSLYQSKVNLDTSNVSYQPFVHPEPAQVNQFPCTYQIKTMSFPPPREPISTHGLDLLSEVALPDTPKEKISSRTERIEKWLNDSLEAEKKKRSLEDTEEQQKFTSPVLSEKSKPQFSTDSETLVKPNISSHVETHKFGQLELLESHKLLKKNLFATEQKYETTRSERQSPTPKKTLTSVQDLLKLQKERKESGKSTADNSPHLKNCKCNNCIVKKGWFKNKPLPKADPQKMVHHEENADSSKPFESLTKAFTKVTGEGQNSKMSASVAPMVAFTVSSPTFKSSVDTANSFGSKDGGERKGLFQQRKSFLERMKERERKEAAAATKTNSVAFSPNNESSVYAFEPEPEKTSGVNEPFRSKIRDSRNSSSSTSRSEEDVLKICEDETPTISLGSQVESTSSDVKGSSFRASQSASIAVQVNLDSEAGIEAESVPDPQDGKSIEISTQTEVPEEDSDTPMFYIPLQQARAEGIPTSPNQQLIQGVALKLGTEGPSGPNQRVIMKAKLVTKPPDTPSIKAVVMPQPKRLFDQKINNPPIGTVQPTTRKPPEEGASMKSLGSTPPGSSSGSKPPKPTGDGSSVGDTKCQMTETEIASSKVSKNQGFSSTTGKSFVKNKEKIQSCTKEKIETSDDSNLPSCSSLKTKKLSKPSKTTESTINPSNSPWLPPAGVSSKLVEAPTFHPTEKDFQDPFEFFDRIRPAAEKFGLCRIVPPSNFKPDCKVSDDMRFTAYNQYVHRMFHRWGPNVKEMMAIKKYLTTQSISLKQPPWIGGIEVDLPRLYQSVQNCGGLMKVMEKKKWHQVADMMKIPKAAQDRVTKLDDIYCKYLLPYDTLSHDERQKLFDEVEKDWAKRQMGSVESQAEDETEEENYIEECEECVVKGRNMALNQFYRIARNTMSMWFKSPEPPSREVENEFWRQVRDRNHHICVHSGSIDSSGWGYGFPAAKNNAFSKHPWNLKVLTNNPGSVLRSLGPVMGVTVPTLHVGMVFTAFCWYRDPHGLPWIEYLHTGAPKIWYGISDDNSTVFQDALSKLLPRYIKNKTIWLPSDTAMIPPDLLVENGVSLCHTVQEPGQFILVFPRAFTSSICTGYLVSESVYFAQPTWLSTAEQVFKDIQESCEPSMFSLEKLLFSIASDSRCSVEVLKQVLPMVWHIRQKEVDGRKTLFNLGLKISERLPSRELGSKKKKGRWAQEDDGDYECEVCRMNLYVSLVTNSHEEAVYCLPHAVDFLTRKRHQLKFCKLLYSFTQEEMNELVEKLEQRIENKSQKKLSGKLLTMTK